MRLLLKQLKEIEQPGRIIVHKLVKDEDPEQHCVLCDELTI